MLLIWVRVGAILTANHRLASHACYGLLRFYTN